MQSIGRTSWTLKQVILAIFVLLPGVVITVISAHYLLGDWVALNGSFHRFETVVSRHGDLTAIYTANAYQLTYRINCFADGVGALGGLIISSIGIVGLCLNQQHDPRE